MPNNFRIFAPSLHIYIIEGIDMITSDQLHDVLERETALRRYL